MTNRHPRTLEAEIVVYRGEHYARRGWMLAALALLLTVAMFVALPFADLVTAGPEPTLDLRPVNAVSVQRIPPPKRLAIPVAQKPGLPRTPDQRLERPKLEAPRLTRRTIPRLNVTLDVPNAVAVAEQPAFLAWRPPTSVGWQHGTPLPTFQLESSLNFSVQPEMIPDAPPSLDEKQTPPVFDTHELDKSPRLLLQTPPSYPYRARARNIEGYVLVAFTLTPEGQPEDIQATAAEPGDLFVQAAKQAVARWRFEPGLRNGEPVLVRMQVKLRFELKQ